MERRYGWRKGPIDDRDLRYSIAHPVVGLPESVDLRPGMPSIYDQGSLGACTAHGIARCIQYAEKQAGLPEIMPSRLFLYYNERVMEGSVNDDAGAIIRDGMKACNIYGIADESEWPYDISKFAIRPPDLAYQAALKERIRFYASLDNRNLMSLKLCLSHGYPIVFGFEVYQNFEDYMSGVLELPSVYASSLGGHCVCISGYDDEKKAFLVANSWGVNFGYSGYFWMSYDYIQSDLCSDFWMVRLK